MVGTWQRLAHVELSSAGDVIDSGTFTAKDNLKVIVNIINDGSVGSEVAFNSDTSESNYASRRSSDGGSDSTYASTANPYDYGFYTGRGDQSMNRYIVMDISNISDKEKLVIGELMVSGGTGAGNSPSRTEFVAKWVNTSSQITSIQIKNNGSGSYAAGSYITVLGASDDTVTDEKTTLTNVPVNTRYEETDTRKIYRWKAESSADATYTEDMSDTTGWSFADTGANNVTNGSLSYNVKRDGSNDAASYDLGSTISNTKFVLRFSRTITAHSHTSGSNCIAFMGLSDNTSGQGTSQDFIGFNFASNDNDGATYKDNTTLVANAVSQDPTWTKLTSGTYYYELKRTSATSVTWTVYTDSDFSTVHRTETDTIPSSITGLRYFKFANWHSSGSGSCNVTGTIDDIQVWDGVDSTTSPAQWVERGNA